MQGEVRRSIKIAHSIRFSPTLNTLSYIEYDSLIFSTLTLSSVALVTLLEEAAILSNNSKPMTYTLANSIFGTVMAYYTLHGKLISRVKCCRLRSDLKTLAWNGEYGQCKLKVLSIRVLKMRGGKRDGFGRRERIEDSLPRLRSAAILFHPRNGNLFQTRTPLM